MRTYDFRSIETKWQAYWLENATFRAPNPGDPGFDPARPKFYVLDMFPYPSGAGLHVGHPMGYMASDMIARYKRMTGHNVLHPMGFDAFGLPAEQYAVETGTHPRVTTEANIETYRRQLRMLGLSMDWDRELSTTDPDYYRWTQWCFLKLFDAWYDPATYKARPLAELEQALEADTLRADAEGGMSRRGETGFDGMAPWSDLDRAGRRQVLDAWRLAFAAEVPVNWCPQLGTVLANEEVTNEGRSERGNFPVFRRPLKQWMLRITCYADRLLADLDWLDWPEPLKLMQRNWIGRSEGARVRFNLDGGGKGSDDASDTPVIEVYTTRPDTLFGATYMVLAPEHELVDTVTTPEQRAAVDDYRKTAAGKSELDRQADTKEKTGVFTGGHAVNPVNQERIPVWIADYVLMGYGTGAIMAVPAGDSRDFEFARKFGLPIRAVVSPTDEWLDEMRVAGKAPESPDLRQAHRSAPESFEEAFTGQGTAMQSANPDISLDGMPTPEATRAVTAWLAERGLGHAEVQYKLRDWLFSRQRYWGEPFPILHGPDGEIVGVPEKDLPVTLPPLDDFRPRGTDDPDTPPQPALSRAAEEWKTITLDGVSYTRELNTMPQWAGSCWYYLRYLDNRNSQDMVAPEIERYWMKPGGVDLYIGGVEHAVLHLLYARFWHKALYDLGHVSTPEPFQRLFNQGYIQAYAYTDERGVYVDAATIEEPEPGVFTFEGRPVTRTLGKMGKSLKNSVSPDEIVEQYGVDTFRLYEMYLGPIDVSKPWNTRAIVGVHRFLQRLWRNLVDEETGAPRVTEDAAPEELRRQLHRTLEQVTRNMEAFEFNTAIARMIELNNTLVSGDTVPREVAEALVLMLAPLAPHVCEELWQLLGHQGSLAAAPWPGYDESLLVEDQVNVVVQVMGKKRSVIRVAADANREALEAAALADEHVQRHIEGKTVRKIIVVPGKLVNIVAN